MLLATLVSPEIFLLSYLFHSSYTLPPSTWEINSSHQSSKNLILETITATGIDLFRIFYKPLRTSYSKCTRAVKVFFVLYLPMHSFHSQFSHYSISSKRFSLLPRYDKFPSPSLKSQQSLCKVTRPSAMSDDRPNFLKWY